jgi:hypothetical protein
LDGATVFEAWKYARSLPFTKEGWGQASEFFIYLDQESIDSLAAAPTQDELDGMTLQERRNVAMSLWVKAVSTSCESDEDGEETDQMMEWGRGRRRLRLYDFFPIFMDMCEGSLDEVRGEDTVRGETNGSEEWVFCLPSWCDQSRLDEIQQ